MSALSKTAEPARFVQQQYAYAAYLRDPDRMPPPAGTDPRRMALIAELFINNINDMLSNAFPVLRRLSDETYWRALVGDFYARHHCHTPLFNQVLGEFLDYLANERSSSDDDPAFLLELAHYEWVELALAIAEEELSAIDVAPGGDLLEEIPVLSPLAWSLSYRFAVHRIAPDYRPKEPDSALTHLLVYRDRHDVVGFIEINPVSARLLAMLEENQGASGREILETIAQETAHNQPEVVIQGGLSLLQELQQRDVILGTRPLARQSPGGVQ